MFKSLSLLIIAALAVTTTAAAASDVPDISVVGDQTMPLTPLGPITPGISVGSHQTDTPDVSVVATWTETATALATTQTECYQVIETDGVTTSIAAQPTVTGTTNPSGYECFLIYATGGGIVHLPLGDADADAAPAPATNNPVITIGLPIIVSFIGLAAIIGAGFVFMRLRARRAATAQRTWVDRPGGWASDNTAGKMESGAATY